MPIVISRRERRVRVNPEEAAHALGTQLLGDFDGLGYEQLARLSLRSNITKTRHVTKRAVGLGARLVQGASSSARLLLQRGLD